MATKQTPSTLAAGLGMGMAFIQALTSEIVAQGGFEEMLHTLTTEHGKPAIKRLAEVIVNSTWRVPRSLIERLVRIHAEHSKDVNVQDRVHFWWNSINLEQVFGIPVTVINNNPGYVVGDLVPKQFMDELQTNGVRYPLLMELDGEQQVVVGYRLMGGDPLKVGQKLDAEARFETLVLAPSKCFDLER
jgi:hypothetical protein